jgi:hypothetical protein
MDISTAEMKDKLDSKWSLLGLKRGDATAEKVMELINREDHRAVNGGNAPMMKSTPKTGIL